jgi:hypothetical protein
MKKSNGMKSGEQGGQVHQGLVLRRICVPDKKKKSGRKSKNIFPSEIRD